MFDKNIFSHRLKLLRTEKGLSQDQLALELSVTKTYVSDIERARRTTTLEKCCELADYFDVPIDFLAGRGLYAKWDEINDHWEKIINAVKEINTQVADSILLLGNDRIHILELLSVFVENVEIVCEPPNTQIDITFKDVF